MAALEEGLDLRSVSAAERDSEVARLDRPWVGDEGALEAALRRGAGGGPLRQRGIAFDSTTTVSWDESGVQVVRAAPPQPGVTARRSAALVHHKLSGPARFFRIDYLREGVLLASRYLSEEPSDA